MKNAGTGLVAVAVALSLFAAPAFACIGPGAGITALSALWSVVVAIVLAVVAVIVWPLRVLFWRIANVPSRGCAARIGGRRLLSDVLTGSSPPR
jgi:hypothetical protein